MVGITDNETQTVRKQCLKDRYETITEQNNIKSRTEWSYLSIANYCAVVSRKTGTLFKHHTVNTNTRGKTTLDLSDPASSYIGIRPV